MMNMMKYKGFIAKIEFSEEDDIFVGRVIGINDSISFHGESKDELKATLASMIEDYLSVCEAEGIEPNKPFSGSFNVRLTPELHRDLFIRAAEENRSINQIVKEAVASYLSVSLKVDWMKSIEKVKAEKLHARVPMRLGSEGGHTIVWGRTDERVGNQTFSMGKVIEFPAEGVN